MKKYSNTLVARIKGAVAAGIKRKVVANLAGVSERAVNFFTTDEGRPEVVPAMFPVELIQEWLLGDLIQSNASGARKILRKGQAREEMEARDKSLSP